MERRCPRTHQKVQKVEVTRGVGKPGGVLKTRGRERS